MMEQALRSRLIEDATLAALVGKRVDWVNRPQASGYPAVTLFVVSDPRLKTMRNRTRLRGTRIQIDVMAKDQPGKVAVREAVLNAIEPRGEFDGVRFNRPQGITIRSSGSDETNGFIHRDTIDVVIWHNG
jgi:hypothetical protein